METKQALDRLDSIEKEAAELRKIIENANKPKNIMERVVDLKSAILEIGESDEEVQEYRKLVNTGIADHIVAGQELVIITKTLNEGKKFTDYYFPYFNLTKKPGSGFFTDRCNSWCEGWSRVSSHLALFNRELALYSGKKFENIHYRYMVKH